MHGNEFKSGGKLKHKLSADYLNDPNPSPAQVSANRTWGPRGFFTSPNKKGIGEGSLLQKKYYPHMADEYDRKKDLDREERMKRRAEDMGKGFRNVVHGTHTFGNNQNEFGEENLNLKDHLGKTQYSGVKHPLPWKYNNESRFAKKTINPAPKYIEEKMGDEAMEKLKKKQKVLPWYYTYNRRSEPADTILNHFKNRPKHNFTDHRRKV